MKMYEVEGEAKIIYSVIIEAKNKKEAEEKFREELEMEGMAVMDSFVTNVQHIKRKDFYD